MYNEIRKIQLKCIEILNLVDYICQKHEIKYSLCGGSVVGAHLYQKCLPWDDDVDVMMTRENYNKFLSVVQSDLPDGFSVHNYQLSDDFSTLFTKIMNDNTTIVQQDGQISGVFLDITVYDKIPVNYKAKIDVLLWKISQVVSIGRIYDGNIKSRLRNLVLSLFFRDKRKYYRFFQKIVERNGNAKEYVYSELFGAFCNTKPYDKNIFENYSKITFEGKKYMIVRDYVKYLETRYERTDFYEPEDKQVAPHYKYVDLERPYRCYELMSNK